MYVCMYVCVRVRVCACVCVCAFIRACALGLWVVSSLTYVCHERINTMKGSNAVLFVKICIIVTWCVCCFITHTHVSLLSGALSSILFLFSRTHLKTIPYPQIKPETSHLLCFNPHFLESILVIPFFLQLACSFLRHLRLALRELSSLPSHGYTRLACLFVMYARQMYYAMETAGLCGVICTAL